MSSPTPYLNFRSIARGVQEPLASGLYAIRDERSTCNGEATVPDAVWSAAFFNDEEPLEVSIGSSLCAVGEA